MSFIGDLWMPIVLSAVFVFIASSIIHMVLKYHQDDVAPAPNQDALQNAIRGAAPGWYAFPLPADPKQRMTPEALKKWGEGPSGMLTVAKPGPMNMGSLLTKWFIFNLVVSFFTAYVAGHALTMGMGAPSYLSVFRVVGTVGFMTYGFATAGDVIWYGRPMRVYGLGLLDALIYGLVMAGTFGWLWPNM